MPGVQRARSLACEIKSHERSPPRSTGYTRHSPRNGFSAYFVLSPVTQAFDTVLLRFLKQRRLTAGKLGAPERHDLTVRFSAIRQRPTARVHRIPPRVPRDDREAAPQNGTGRQAYTPDCIWVARQSILSENQNLARSPLFGKKRGPGADPTVVVRGMAEFS